jgi:hypothetical protein
MALVIKTEDCVRVLLERCIGIDQAQLPRHTKMNDQQKSVTEADEDELPPPPQRLDVHTRHRVDELLGLGMADDRRKEQLAADDGATDKVRPQVADDCFYFREFRH